MHSLIDRIETTLERLIAWTGVSALRRLLLIGIVALAVILPGIAAMPVTDRDEARFAQATKQMLESGDLIDIRFQDQPRWKKPAGIYWLQAVSTTAFGDGAASQIWAYRVPSALGALIAATLLGWAAAAQGDRIGGLLFNGGHHELKPRSGHRGVLTLIHSLLEHTDPVRGLASAEGALSGAVGRLFAVMEAYPDLKASANMQQLSEELTSTENKVAFSRQAFNDSVTSYNTYRRTFPAIAFAGLFGHGRDAMLLEFESEKIAEAPKVSFN